LLNLVPELVVRNSAAFIKLFVRFLKNRPEGAGATRGQLLGFILVPNGQEHGDRLAVARDEHRLVARGF
jgi:hypothetical protein